MATLKSNSALETPSSNELMIDPQAPAGNVIEIIWEDAEYAPARYDTPNAVRCQCCGKACSDCSCSACASPCGS